MGIKYLWTILGPFYERKPLYELQGKTVAVDLSCWICEAQNIAEYQVQPRMYLRNLFFRTCYLLLMEVYPVFVLEGKAPELKFDTIASRNAIQFKGAKPKTDGVKTGKDRTRFHFTLKQCQEMLDYMGLACIKGSGEAESLCAYLNEDGLVAGCISQDSDCFAYGAKVVYRNFSISQQGSYAANGGAVDVYDIEKAQKNIDFGRNKIIALALLCGSDYNSGVHGVGKDSVMKLFENVSEEDILARVKSWKEKDKYFEELEEKLNNKNICTSCGHFGKLQNHTKNGCNNCGTTKGCESLQYKEERLRIKNEIGIRNKALLQDPNFPNEELINEFTVKKDNVQKLNLKWKQPDLIKFIKFTTKFLEWKEIYGFEKLFLVLTRWQLLNYENNENLTGIVSPDYIKKIRNPKGVPSYEIIWVDKQNYFNGLIPEDQLENVDKIKLWSTIEPQHLVETAYPKLVEDFKLSKMKPKKTSKRKQQQKDKQIDELNDLMKNTSISEPKVKKTRKKTQITKKTIDDLEKSLTELQLNDKAKTIDFYKKAIINNSTPVKTFSQDCSFDLDLSNFGDEDDHDLSDIVEKIVNQKIPNYVKENLFKLGFEEKNSSSFFISNAVENDMFENVLENENSSTEEDTDNVPEDSFQIDNYIPLVDRLRNS